MAMIERRLKALEKRRALKTKSAPKCLSDFYAELEEWQHNPAAPCPDRLKWMSDAWPTHGKENGAFFESAKDLQ